MRWSIEMKKLMLVVLLVFFQVLVLSTLVFADVSWITNPSNGHKYSLVDAIFWDSGEQVAVSYGGHLVTINDANENAWVLGNLLIPSTKTRAWIGLFEEPSSPLSAYWQWISGETVTFMNNWPFPDSSTPKVTGDYYAIILLNGDWYDIGGNYFSNQYMRENVYGIVEKAIVEVTPVPETSSFVSLFACIPSILLLKKKRYIN